MGAWGGIINALANALLGWRRYRVKFTYKNKRGLELFSFTNTVGVRSARHIDDHRAIKKGGSR